MKYREQKELVADLRALADFYERPASIVLPKPYFYVADSVTAYEYDDVTGQYQSNIEKSKHKIKQIAKSVGSCEKKWDGDLLRIVKKIGHITLTWSVKREAVCKRVPTGEVITHPAYFQPERTEEKVEWVCEDVSLLS